MKKLIIPPYITLTICLLSVSNISLAQPKIKIVATTSIFIDMIKNIAGDRAEVVSIVGIGGDPHIYEAVPQDVVKIKNADLIFINGLNFEGWISKIIFNSGSKSPIHVLTKGIEPITSQDHADSYDPHAWMTAKNGMIYIDNIYKALAAYSPSDAALFKANYDKYYAAMTSIDKYITDRILSIPEGQRILITTHDAFRYYGNAYGLTINAMQGISTESDIQTSDMKRITSIIKSFSIPSIFVESTINPKLFEQISQDAKINLAGPLFSDSLGEEESAANTYINLLKANTDMIVDGLTLKDPSSETSSSKNQWLYFFIGLMMIVGWILFYINIKS